MRLIYLSNFFNDHQKPLADILYRELGEDYHFIETTDFGPERQKLGFPEYNEPYTLRYKKVNRHAIDQMVFDADVVICGEAPATMVRRRARAGKLIFRDDESRYKALIKYLKWPIYTKNSLIFNKGYLLCASAFGCRDYHISGMPVRKCFKWGYFTQTITYEDIDKMIEAKESDSVSILWVGRLIGWKHPEFAIKVAQKLRDDNIRFHLDIIGAGPLENRLKKMIKEVNLSEEHIRILGAMPPSKVREYMEKSQILLATSDRGEGWGATLNEAMNSGCAVVANPEIGAAPYLITEGENGLFYDYMEVNSLYEKTKWLIEHPDERKRIGKAAYQTIYDKWSAPVAARNLLKLIDSLKLGKDPDIQEGPCSKAPLIKRSWYKKKNA